ncbi:hypothetical protein EJB05_36947, partial [Eragrostis curvula]
MAGGGDTVVQESKSARCKSPQLGGFRAHVTDLPASFGQDARRPFDGMPIPSRGRSTASGVDRISGLPEGVIHHVLSLLPAHDAVRTSVLARRWRHLWSSAPGLRVTGVKGWRSSDKFVDFVERLLSLRRGGAPLEWFEFHLDPSDFDFKFRSYELAEELRGWIGRALGCNVRALRLSLEDINMADFCLGTRPLFSQHLTRLEVDRVRTTYVLDLSGCPTLVEMKMEYCFIDSDAISSASLKKLTMIECDFRRETWDKRTRISLPSLTSLELTLRSGRAPLLGSMPSLESAIVSLNYGCEDYYKCDEDSYDGSQYYYKSDDDRTSCFLLNGLSEATHLQLSSYSDVFVFSQDVKRCPKFTNLKTLVLSDWCFAADLNALICFLQHSPTLEELTLQLSELPECSLEQGNYKLLEPSYVSHHLKVVVIKCEEVDGKVSILSALASPTARDKKIWDVIIPILKCTMNFVSVM